MNSMKRRNKRAFTIVELLTVMSIITILISLLVPGLNRVRRYARRVRQKAQFHSIEVGLDMFYTEREEYPDSSYQDTEDVPYCGAMKLAEAMMGQDMLGFHPDSVLRHDGLDATGTEDLYPDPNGTPASDYASNLRSRKKVGLQLENANAYRVGNIYDEDVPPGWGNFDGEELLLCDVYTKNVHKGFTGATSGVEYDGTGKKIGMPILYYRAHDRTVHYNADNTLCIYDYEDNDDLVALSMPWDPTHDHPINDGGGDTPDGDTADSRNFYDMIRNDNIAEPKRPYKSDSYILISAGFDGQYGTRDDVFNFEN